MSKIFLTVGINRAMLRKSFVRTPAEWERCVWYTIWCVINSIGTRYNSELVEETLFSYIVCFLLYNIYTIHTPYPRIPHHHSLFLSPSNPPTLKRSYPPTQYPKQMFKIFLSAIQRFKSKYYETVKFMLNKLVLRYEKLLSLPHWKRE